MAHSTDMAHALLGASSSHRWLHCTPSARMEEPIPNESSIFADEGTMAHAWGAFLIKSALELDTTAEEKEMAQYGQWRTDEMLGHVEKYYELVLGAYGGAKERWKTMGGVAPQIKIEQHLDYRTWVPGGFGTGDAAVVGEGFAHIIDLKYGKGVRVMAQDNPQLKLYALGVWQLYDYLYGFERIRMTICQPRLDHIDSWTVSTAALLDWAERVLKPQARLAWEGKGETVSGTWCRFCRAKHICPAKAAEAFNNFKF